MPEIKMYQTEKLTINFPLFDSNKDITGYFDNKETLQSEQGFVVRYHSLLYNIENEHVFLARITPHKQYAVDPQEPYELLMVASNLDDLAIWKLEKEKENERVEIKLISGFKFRQASLPTEENLRKRNLLPQK